MKKKLLLILTIVLFFGCKEETKIDKNYVISKFQENAENINSLEYNIRRIDTFAQGGTVWNNTGNALIEKDPKDKIFGFSFYGKRDDVPKEYIYDAGNGFEISTENKTYEIETGNYGFIGSPGGQMIPSNVFSLDSIYKKVTLSEKEDCYVLKYEFENDTVYNVTDIIKNVHLRKNDFFPIMINRTSIHLGNKTSSQSIVSDIRINNDVSTSIEKLKEDFKDYEIIQPKERKPNELLSKKLPKIELPNLFDENDIVSVNSDKLTLIDFWEVWCGPCIASFPKVENLKNKYSTELNVVGIVSESPKSARRLIEKKKTTFQNLVGNDELKTTFRVDSWPRYFLVDKNGIVQKEYFGFTEQIEEDINEMITE